MFYSTLAEYPESETCSRHPQGGSLDGVAMRTAPIAVLLTLCVIMPGCIQQSPEHSQFNGEEVEGSPLAPLFTLEDSENNLWNMEEQKGKVVILAFIYTRCVNTCPVISANLALAKSTLTDAELNQTVWVSITIDPYHDSPQILEDWRTGRNYDWPHLTGADTAVNPVLDAYEVDPIVYEDDSEEGYNFNHPQPTYIIDTEGRMLVVWTDPDVPYNLFVEDLRTVLSL